MLAVRLSENLDIRLAKLAKATGRTKSYYTIKALEEYLENREDYLLAIARLEEGNPTISLEKLEKELGLGNKNRRKGTKRAAKARMA